MRFSADEMARRYRLGRGLMDELDLEALVLFGNSGVNRHNNVNPFWLSQYLDMHHCYLVVPRAEDLDPALFVGEAEGRVSVVVPLDDAVRSDYYRPLTRYVLNRACLSQ